MTRWNIVKKLEDGTVIYRNPFADTEAWFLPERKFRPSHTDRHATAKPLQLEEPQNYCAFCPTNYFLTTPEKSRIEFNDGDWQLLDKASPQHIFNKTADFRRISNLYEIISTSYWQKNYEHHLSAANQQHKEMYLADPNGREHVQSLLKHKYHGLKSSHKWTDAEIEQHADAFFGGAHELIIPRQHYIDGATDESHLASTGSLTPEEHYHYMRLTCHSVASIYANNAFLKYVGVYTNWRRDAGASFEHLHRQVIGVDQLGFHLQNRQKLAASDQHIFKDYITYVAYDLGFVLCENEHAIAFVDIGHTFSSIAIYSKSVQTLPWRQSPEELRGMSDLIHAVHAAFGAQESVNEEWYYQPPHSDTRIPWAVLIRWRNHRHAGIESITDIFPDEYGPVDLKNILLGKMFKLRAEQKIANMALDTECDENSLVLNYID
jgi:galactose-1-phosphate uridylyltransferase